MDWSESVARLEATRRSTVVAAWSAAVSRMLDLAGDVAAELAAADLTVADLVAEVEQLRAQGVDRVQV